jgi:o-succinylbenzoate---CoA ligase
VPDLVAIDLEGEPFVTALLAVWDRGDTALPVDHRLPADAADALVAAMHARSVITAAGEHIVGDGEPTAAGDALVMATSGSTGTPKGVVLTHDAIAASARASHDRLGVTAGDRWLACLPLAHVGGLSVVTRALLNGVPLTVHSRFDAAAVTQAAVDGATLTSLVPTALARIDASCFRRIVLGGSRMPPDRPANTVATYGMTETGSGVVYDGVPLDGVEVRIAPDGEILVRGPMLLRCYRDGTSPVDNDGWLHTDDAGRCIDTADGVRLAVDGRRGDMIVTGGENVWPEVVEAVLAGHPLVAEVGVAGVADNTWGQRVTAFVVPIDPGRPPTVDDLRLHTRTSLPAFMAPREVVILAALPRTNLQKIRRNILSTLGR